MNYSKGLVVILMSLYIFSVDAQVCGTSKADQQIMVENIEAQREQWMKYLDRADGAVTYIPVKFYRVSQDDGTGKVSISSVMDQLCRLNRDYEPYEIQFYLKGGPQSGIITMRSQSVYDDPSTSTSTTALRSQVSRNKDAVNVFVSNSANSGSGGAGVTLGFYNRIGDYIVMQKSEVERATPSLSHEMGHFFSLAHTFFGWEATEYDCSTPTPDFIGGIGVEYESRTQTRNGARICLGTADRLCGTAADYNLGFGWSGGCDYAGCAKDPDEVQLDPDERNFMSYFTGCLETLTDDQLAVVLNDIASARRNYVRDSYVPDLTPSFDVRPALVVPENRSNTQYYDEVFFDWEPVAGANLYLIEIEEFGRTNDPVVAEYVTGTNYTATTLLSRKIYNWKVRPVAEMNNCSLNSDRWRFTTSTIMTSTIDSELDENFTLLENPTSTGSPLRLQYSGSKGGEFQYKLVDMNGQLIKESNVELGSGAIATVGFENLAPGIYSMVIIQDDKFTVKKWIRL